MKIAKLAVSAAPYAIDKPYDYRIPDALTDKVAPGVRVTVPFGRGNRRSEGIVLSVSKESSYEKLKCIEGALDDGPVLNREQLQLAIWMSNRFFCTVYEAARVLLPAGMWFKDGVRRVGDKTVSIVRLAVPAEEAMITAGRKRARAPQQSAVLEFLSDAGDTSMDEVRYYTGASRESIKALEKLGLISLIKREVFRKPEIKASQAADPIILNEEQQRAFNGLETLLEEDSAEAALLYGVTGSGKTSVYIRLIEKTIALGKTALVLVPEIALTPQLIGTFAAYFGEGIAVLHSALGIGERYDEWKQIRSGKVNLVVGTRSAVFAPLSNLGLIIIDEEQEYTYKSENSPRYHARDVAKYRCYHSKALLILGSATPSVESMYSAETGRYHMFSLENRYNERELPSVIIADMREELKNGNGSTVSSVLERELRRNIERGEQSILFLNRRGANTLIACGECGYTYTCPRCSVSLTYHLANKRLMCHYCGYSEPASGECPECGGKLKYIGAGTQKAEAELMEMFPGVGIIRMDTDTVSASHSHEVLLSRFRNEKVPILLGTQMVAKGLDFENVTLVGVLSADQSLYVNDFRAHERTFSLITQVVGRSGRGEKPGRAVIQTFTPLNEVIRLAAKQDYMAFYEQEIDFRKILGCPPAADLITLTASGTDEAAVLYGCTELKAMLEGYFRCDDELHILGPAPANVAKVNNMYRFRLMLSCQNKRPVRDTVAHTVKEFSKDKRFRGVYVFADCDPYE